MTHSEDPWINARNGLSPVLVRTTASYWAKIVTFKHPNMAGQESAIEEILQQPTEIRRSQSDPEVYLY